MTELKNAGVDVTPEVSAVPLLSLFRLFFSFSSSKSGLLTERLFPQKMQNLQNMMGSIGEPGQAGDDVGGRKK
jgi:hypothetical protein